MEEVVDEYYDFEDECRGGMAIKFEPGSDEWREGVADGLHRTKPKGGENIMYQSGFYLGWSIALERLKGGYDDI